MTGDDILALLGRPSDDPDVLNALDAFGIRWAPELELDDEQDGDDEDNEPDWYVWRPSSANGIEFGFQDRAHFEAASIGERGEDGPLILTSVAFYGEHDGVQPFSGRLPWGLELSDSRHRVHEKLAGLEVSPRVHRRDVWEAGDRRVIVEHTRGDTVANVLVRLPSQPWPNDGPAPLSRPTPDQLRAMFGMRWHEEGMRRWLFPLGLDRCGKDISIHRYADLGRHHGLELYFFRDPARAEDSPIKDKGAVFGGAKFSGRRVYDASEWQGELPFGLSFRTAYPDILAVVGRAPDVESDEDLGGFAVWNFKDHTMHIRHDNVDNLILSVGVFAPGAWKPMDL